MRTTVIIVAHNELEKVQMCVETITIFMKEAQIVVVDNASEDGLQEWLGEHPEFSSAVCEREESYASILNQVIDAFALEETIMLIDLDYLLTPGCYEKMVETLFSAENIGIAGAMVAGGVKAGKADKYADVAELAIKYSRDNFYQRVLAVGMNVILLKRSVIEEVGKFDEQFKDVSAMWMDYQQRAIREHYFCAKCYYALCYSYSGDKNTESRLYNELMQNGEANLLEEKYGMHYFNYIANYGLIDLVERERNEEFSVLEIGCDCGATLLAIKELYPHVHIYGAEINQAAAKVASYVAEDVQCVDIEKEDWVWQKGSLDYIIFGDVLEHLRDPQAVVEKCYDILKPDGKIIASIPNVMHISVVEDLLKGNFTYRGSGLLDRTHIHLFTKKEIEKMFYRAGYSQVDMKSYQVRANDRQRVIIDTLLKLEPETTALEYETFQYCVLAGK